MKKIISIGFILISLSISAQDEGTIEYGPVAGNFAVGIAANPAFEYLGNFFGKTNRNNAPTANLSNNYHLFVKYFTSDYTAIRAGVQFNYDTETSFFGIDDKDRLNETEMGVGIALGLESRIGQNRIQAFYGPSVGLGYFSAKDVYKYDGTPAGGALLEEKYGSDLSLALGAFAGVEYFICKNIAIGTEIGMGVNFSTSGKGENMYQGGTRVETGSKSQSMSIGFNDTSAQLAPRGVIYFSIYF